MCTIISVCTKQKVSLHEQFLEHITPMEGYFFKTQKLAKEQQHKKFCGSENQTVFNPEQVELLKEHL